MAYSHTTLTQAKAILAARLADPSSVFWLDAEIALYLIEALRTWNSMAFYDRARVTFDSIANQAFYDLTSTTDTGAGAGNPPAFLAPTLTDRNLVNLIQYHLLEPITTDWTLLTPAATEQFSVSDIVGALQRRRDQFLMETGLILTHSTQAMSAAPENLTTLSQNIEDVRRVSWRRSSDLRYFTLFRDDLRSATAQSTTFVGTAGTPKVYDIVTQAPTQLRVLPAPSVNGSLDLVSVNAGATLDVSTGVLLGVPDDLAWVVKYGAMADLLGKDGQSRDAARAKYCEERWKEGLELAKIFTSVINYSLEGTLNLASSIKEFDTLSVGWQTPPSADPQYRRLGLMSWNLVAIAPVPIDTVPTITADVLSNMTVPTAGGDQIQVGKEHVDVIIDYAEHLAAFKMAGSEFESTVPHLERMMRSAMQMNDRLRAAAKNFDILRERREQRQRPQEEEAAA